MITDPEAEIQYGTKIGRFAVVGELGKGGMGVVYSAHDRELDRKVALKVLRAAAATDEERMRMLREGQAMARITHPNVITVYEVGVEGTLVFLAQELLDAGTLGQWLEKKSRTQAAIIDKFVAAGRGLATRREDRYPTIEALLADLTRPPSRRGRTVAVALAALVLVAGAVVGGYALKVHDDDPKPLATFDPKTLTNDRGVEWLSAAIERGQLDDAAEKYDMAGALAAQGGDPVRSSIARSTGALVLALRGKLDAARAHLRDADAAKGNDATAIAFADMASAAVSFAAGDLAVALRASSRCATELAAIPELAAMCHELHGRAAADRGDVTTARAAYADGLAIAKRIESEPRTITLQIAVAALDLDEGKHEEVVTAATTLQTTAATRGAVGPEVHAWILLARAHIAQAATQKALEDLQHVRSDAIEPFQARIEQRIALGEVNLLLGDPEEGWKQLDAARTEAETAGCPGLVLAARLARLEVLTATSAPDAAAEQRSLVADARAKGYGRIAHLAETVAQR